MMTFAFDAHKSVSNKVKRGIDFIQAQAIWNDPDVLEIPTKVKDEPRFLIIGRRDGKHWSAIITYRGEKIRIISVRRSRSEEVKLYES